MAGEGVGFSWPTRAHGTPWTQGDCIARVLRGGAWRLGPEYMRSARRYHYDRDVRYYLHGLRVARELVEAP